MMSHYEQRLEQDLTKIRARVREVGEKVEKAVTDALHALLTGDRDLAARTILGDLPINRAVRAIDRLCHAFVARHLPSAGHLRFVSSVLRLNVALERIGDYAVTICREAVQLTATPPDTVIHDVELIGDQAKRVLHQAMRSFDEGNPELARGTKGMARQVEGTFQKVFADLLREGEQESRPVQDLFGLLVVIHDLGRVSDQAKNICEETLFAVAGETKEPKVYRVLFLDARNDGLSQVAEAYAKRAFPDSGRYSSAGWEPAAKLDTQCATFLEAKGYDTAGLAPKKLTPLADELAEQHVIVSLEGDGRPHLPALPFHTVLLHWEVGPSPAGLDRERAQAALEECFQGIALRVRELMETLRGADAA